MRTASEMMMHCSSTAMNMVADGAEMSVLDQQKARLKWQQLDQHEEEEVVVAQSYQQNCLNEAQLNLLSLHQFLNAFLEGNAGSAPVPMPEFSARPVKKDPGLDNGWPDFTNSFLPPPVLPVGLTTPAESYAAAISRTSSCPPLVGNAAVEAASDEKPRRPALPKVPSPSKKRKAIRNTRVIPMEEYKDKRVKGETQETEPKQVETAPKREASVDTSKDNSKVSEVQQKPDYIHVRARRGQATDSHSLAERMRREKISERMKYLQDLVPGCNKITGKAGMLDEIINYVQSLQRQVEFLSMKLATVNPRLDFNIDNSFAKEIFPPTSNPYPILAMLPELSNQAFLQYNQPQPVVTCGGPNVTVNTHEMALRRTTSAPVSAMDSFIDTRFQGQASSSTTWEIDLQTLYNTKLHQGRQSAF